MQTATSVAQNLPLDHQISCREVCINPSLVILIMKIRSLSWSFYLKKSSSLKKEVFINSFSVTKAIAFEAFSNKII